MYATTTHHPILDERFIDPFYPSTMGHQLKPSNTTQQHLSLSLSLSWSPIWPMPSQPHMIHVAMHQSLSVSLVNASNFFPRPQPISIVGMG